MAATPSGVTVAGLDGAVEVGHDGATGATGYLYRWRRTDHPAPPNLVTQNNPGPGLDRIDQPSLPLNSQYRYTWTGQGVDVYVLETGMRYTHNDFAGRTLPGASFITGGVHNQDNGSDHGTAVASLVAGTVHGVAKQAKVGNVRTRTSSGGFPPPVQPLLDGLNWILANRDPNVPTVVNLSAPGHNSSDAGYAQVRAAWQAVLNAGIHVVHSAGYGDRNPYPAEVPGELPGAFFVSQHNLNDANSDNSDYNNAHIWASGIDVPAAGISSNTASTGFGGTSASAPLVAGAIALLLQPNPHLTPVRAKEVLISQAHMGVTGIPSGPKPILNARATTANWSQGPMGLSAVIDGLEPDGAYEVSVASMEAGQVSAWSTPIAVTASSGPAPETGILLSSASALYIGTQEVSHVFVGSTLVWEAEEEPPPHPATPTVVGVTTGGRLGAGTFTLALPTGAAGYVAYMGGEGSDGIATPAGWTLLASTPTGGRIYTTASPSPGTGWNKTMVGPTGAVVVGYSTPVTVTGFTAAAGQVSPSIMTTAPALVLRGVNDQPDDPAGAITYPAGAPDGQAEGRTSDAGYSGFVAVAHATQGDPGATGTAQWAVPSAWQPQAWTAQITATP